MPSNIRLGEKLVDWLDSWVRAASVSTGNLESLPFLIAHNGKTLLKNCHSSAEVFPAPY